LWNRYLKEPERKGRLHPRGNTLLSRGTGMLCRWGNRSLAKVIVNGYQRGNALQHAGARVFRRGYGG